MAQVAGVAVTIEDRLVGRWMRRSHQAWMRVPSAVVSFDVLDVGDLAAASSERRSTDGRRAVLK